jgi:uncharacterized protein (TIGR04168 family)
MRIAIIGDVHEHWGDEDLAFFASESFDLLLFVGDLPGFSHRNTESVARSIAGVQTPAILIPGNHDGTSPLQVLAEATRIGCDLARWAAPQQVRVERLRAALGPVQLAGYSVHPRGGFDVVAGRPHAMDGRHLSFAPYLEHRFSISDWEASSKRLRKCVDRCTQPIVFLSHNGPSGLGGTRDDLYGRSDPEFDNGDPDLAMAIAYAREEGHIVLASVSGHMHHRGDGGMRRWTLEKDGVRYINAARVPRVFQRDGRTLRHCVELTVDRATTRVREILFD